MFTITRQRVRAYMSQRVYSFLGIFFLLLSLTLTTHAMLTVSNSGLSGDANVTVDGSGTLSIGTASSTGVVIGKGGAPVTLQGPTAITGALTLGVANTTAGQLLFNNASNSFTTLLRSSSSQASNLAFTLPNTAGTSGQAMLTDGTGNLYFGTGSSTGVSQAALDLKAPLASPTFTGNVTIGTTVLGSTTSLPFGSSKLYYNTAVYSDGITYSGEYIGVEGDLVLDADTGVDGNGSYYPEIRMTQDEGIVLSTGGVRLVLGIDASLTIDGLAGVTVSGSSCTITQITKGIITGATCTP